MAPPQKTSSKTSSKRAARAASVEPVAPEGAARRKTSPTKAAHHGPQSVDWSPAQVGRALRAIRVARGLSINDLARESDLSASFLSQVETGQSDLSVGRLVRVAQALGVTAADILNLPAPANGSVVRAEDRVRMPVTAKGVSAYLLASTLDKKRTFSLAIFEKGAKIPMPVRNRGSEYFVYVIDGALRLEFTTGEVLMLHEGDSAARISDESRLMANAHDGETTFLFSQAARSHA
jgi:transcriptional regulator with XRE-family HTH domain